MRKIQMVLIGTFITGVLMTGVGVGMAMIEYSSFQYGGEKLWYGEADSVKILEFQIPEEKEMVILGEHQHYEVNEAMTVVESAEVPKGVLQYEITYNETLVEPYLYYEEQAGALDVRLEYCGDDFKAFMENKDLILDELKERKISSYHTVYVTEVTVKVNPETVPYVKTGFHNYP